MAPKTEPATRYYDMDGVPVVWEPGKFPRIAQGRYLYDCERLALKATAITKTAFEKLVTENETLRAT